jgi:hypothetical protein
MTVPGSRRKAAFHRSFPAFVKMTKKYQKDRENPWSLKKNLAKHPVTRYNID